MNALAESDAIVDAMIELHEDGREITSAQVRRAFLNHGLRIERDWQPIDTAPVEPFDKVPNYYRFQCLLQGERGDVGEGWAYYVPPPRSRPLKAPLLRWANRIGQCFPKYWMPLPAPKVEEV